MFVILALVVLVIAGIFLWRYFGSYESTDDAQIDGHLNSISRPDVRTRGQTQVQDNQYVEAGTALVKSIPRDYQVAVDRAQADYRDASATAKPRG